GAGPTGVELAAEIAEFVRQMLKNNYKHLRIPFHVYLLQRGDMIMPFVHPQAREQALQELRHQGVTVHLHSEVTRVLKDSVEINKKERLSTHTVIWTSGVKPHTINTIPSTADKRGFFHVDHSLQVKGLKDVFALGDCAFFVNPGEQKPVPALAQTATLQAKIVAKNIIHALRHEPLETAHIRLSGLIVSVGQKFAVADLHGIRFSGFIAWWLW
ncbi:MAG: FAD-dependent oxidoreductase, partial [Nanoarchaeota archaeon]